MMSTQRVFVSAPRFNNFRMKLHRSARCDVEELHEPDGWDIILAAFAELVFRVEFVPPTSSSRHDTGTGDNTMMGKEHELHIWNDVTSSINFKGERCRCYHLHSVLND